MLSQETKKVMSTLNEVGETNLSDFYEKVELDLEPSRIREILKRLSQRGLVRIFDKSGDDAKIKPMEYTIYRTRVRTKHKYIPGRYNNHTEYRIEDENGKELYNTENGRIQDNVYKFKDYINRKFDIEEDNMVLSERVNHHNKQGWM